LKDKVKRERDRNGNDVAGPSKKARKSVVEEIEIEVVDLTGD
jgi:hypothetical protein